MIRLLLAFVLVCLQMMPALAQEATLTGVYDLVLTNGRVLDPESNLDAENFNVGIRGDKIAVVTDRELRGRETIDVGGLVIAPGFIDLGSGHLQTFGMRMQAYDGVTTVLDLESGRLPIGKTYKALAKSGQPLNYGVAASWSHAKIWAMGKGKGRPDGSLAYLDRTLSGGKLSWAEHSTPEQREKLVGLVRDAVTQGALGISIDARYVPDLDYSEAISLLEVAKENKVVTFFGSYNDDLRGIGDLVALTMAVGTPTHLCQFNARGNEDKKRAVTLLERCRSQNLEMSLSGNPYGAESALPRHFPGTKGGDYYKQIRSSAGGLDAESFRSVRANGSTEPLIRHFLWTELVRQMTPEEQDNLDGLDQARVRDDKEKLRLSMMFPGGSVASSATPWRYLCEQGSERPSKGVVSGRLLSEVHDQQWPPRLPTGVTLSADPRSAATFTRVLRDWVAWEGRPTEFRMSPLEAVRKMSLRPAQLLEKSVPQMKSKGRLQAGMDADLVVFDPKALEERATYGQPAQHCVGMKHVLVNGQFLIQNWEMKMVLPGRPIRRPAKF